MLALLRFATVARLFLPYVFPYILRSKPWEKLGKFKIFLHIKKGKMSNQLSQKVAHKKEENAKSTLQKVAHKKGEIVKVTSVSILHIKKAKLSNSI